MNVFLRYAGSAKGDTRCEKCKHHTFLIWSSMLDVDVIHSNIHLVAGNKFPYLLREQGIHWWSGTVLPPECLKSYKKIGGK